MQLLDGNDRVSSQLWQWQPSLQAVLTADTLSGQLLVYGQGQNCLPCHLLCLTFKMMKHRESDPWQDLFKEQPLGNGGSRVWQHAGGLISPLLKRPNTESLARGEGHAGRGAILCFEALSNTSAVFPAWINISDFYLVKLLFCPFSLLSSLLLLPCCRWKDMSGGHKTLSLFFCRVFTLLPSPSPFLVQLAPSLSLPLAWILPVL